MTRATCLLAILAGCGSKSSPPPPAAAVALDTPESVLYDAAHDRYIISNIKGTPNEKDGNGFLTIQAPGGAMTAWPTAAKLDAPKGSALVGDTLWVADITTVRRFDGTGAQLPDIAVEGSSFLNDVVADGAGGIYVSDTGPPNANDAIYHVDATGKVSTLIKDKSLGGPNGLAIDAAGTLWVVTLGSGELYSVDAHGTKGTPQKLPKGTLDGLVILPGGDFLVSSWEAKAIYRGKPGGDWTEIATGIESPADIGFDAKRNAILVPVFTKNEVKVIPLP